MATTTLKHLVRLLGSSVLLVLAVIVILFFLLELAPGDPIQSLVGDAAVPESFRAQIATAYGLDRPLWERFFIYMSKVLTGDLGYSYANRTPVAELIVGRLGNTLILTIPALVISTIGAIVLGSLAARTRSAVADRGVSMLAVAGFSIPSFWLALLLIMLFSVNLGWLPAQGMSTLGSSGVSLPYLVLPVLSLAAAEMAFKARIMRSTLIEVLGQDFIDTARSKGLSNWEILRSHGLLNAMIPLIAVIGYSLGYTIAGAVTIEKVFSWPGMGLLLFTSIQKGDNQVVIGIMIVFTVTVVIVNILTDVVYGIVDPRIRARRRAQLGAR